jgi:putative membrane protein
MELAKVALAKTVEFGSFYPYGGRMLTRATRGISLLGVCALSAACSKGGPKVDSAAMADSVAKAAAAAAVPAAPAAVVLTDANIFALLDEANAADSAGGNLASTKGTAASVKEFGRTMMKDHHALRKGGQDLAKKLKITPAPPANDTLPAAAQKMADNMKAQPKGAAWDKAYIDNEIALHQAVLALLSAGQAAAQDTSLKAAIVKAQPLIQGHLTKAQDIQSKLGATAATGGDTAKKKAP